MEPNMSHTKQIKQGLQLSRGQLHFRAKSKDLVMVATYRLSLNISIGFGQSLNNVRMAGNSNCTDLLKVSLNIIVGSLFLGGVGLCSIGPAQQV